MKLNKSCEIETSHKLKTHENIDINKLLLKNIHNTNKNKANIFFIRKIRDIVLISILISIIVGIVIFSVVFFKEKNKKILISFNQSLNNTEKLDGYYIPKDRLSNPFYKKCSVENCKNCYGNSYNDTCIACLNSFEPLLNENSQIVSCKYNPQKKGDNDTALKESDIILVQ